MKKYLFGIFAVVLAVGAVAFTNPPEIKKDSTLTNYYFRFIGIPNSEEQDVEKWEIFTTDPVEYANMTCGKPKFGCKLVATQTQVVNSVTRPAAIYLASGTQNPIPGTHVSSVSNLSN